MREKGIGLTEHLRVTRLISAFYYEFPQSFAYEGEQHSGWEFVYVHSGKVSVVADDMTYLMKTGELVCHKPYEFHSIRPCAPDTSVIIFCFECDGETMRYFNNKLLTVTKRQREILLDIAQTASEVFLPKQPLDIVRDGCMDSVPEPDPLREQLLKTEIEYLILSLMRGHSTERKKRAESFRQMQQRTTLTEDIRQYLQENMEQSIRLDMLSERFCYSGSSIKRIFREETGCTVTDYLTRLRIDRAKELLTETDASVSAVAEAVGYSGVFYFSDAFKKATGLCPTAYRRAAFTAKGSKQ